MNELKTLAAASEAALRAFEEALATTTRKALDPLAEVDDVALWERALDRARAQAVESLVELELGTARVVGAVDLPALGFDLAVARRSILCGSQATGQAATWAAEVSRWRAALPATTGAAA